MTVLMFEPRFVAEIEAGEKTSTIRQKRKRPIKPGDVLSLRRWEGKPYRPKSKQVEIKQVRCTRVSHILVRFSGVEINSRWLNSWERHELSVADGFEGVTALRAYLGDAYGLPFEGELIEWEET